MKTIIPFGLHIPKCAGTTLLDRFIDIHGDDLYQSTSIAKNFKFGRKDLSDFEGIWPFKFYYGHHLHSEMLRNIDGVPFLFTILRDPVDRAVSHYRYQNRLRKGVNKNELPVDVFLNNNQTICRFIIQRFSDFVPKDMQDKPDYIKAWSILKRFDHVGFMDALDETSSVLTSVAGMDYDFSRKRNGSPVLLTDEEYMLRESMIDALSDDIMLYYYCKKLKQSPDTPSKQFVRRYSRKEFNFYKFYKFYSHAVFSEFKGLNRLDDLESHSFSNPIMQELVTNRCELARKV